jgi:hypothetical protein
MIAKGMGRQPDMPVSQDVTLLGGAARTPGHFGSGQTTGPVVRWRALARPLLTVAVLGLSAPSLMGAGAAGKPTFDLTWSSDTTHILSTISPYHAAGQPLSASMFQASVDEVADTGADVFLLQPGLGWVPWWDGQAVPLADHQQWFQATYGNSGNNAFMNYVLAGNDFIQTTIDQAHARGMAAFVSYRLNDLHHLDQATNPASTRNGTLAQFYVDNPQYQLGAGPGQPTSAHRRGQNWAIPEVRDYKFSLIQELAQIYNIDGLELDFMRDTSYFRQDQTTGAQRSQIMTDFIGQVRGVLDQTGGVGGHRWLSVRIPGEVEAHDAMGIDVPALAGLGVDMVTITNFAQYAQQMDIAAIRQSLGPDVALYVEMFDNASVTRAPDNSRWQFRKTTRQQMITGAHLAYSRGADGVTMFNMPYYRENVNAVLNQDGPSVEPPFSTIERLDDPQWLARQSQLYFVGSVWDNPKIGNRPLPDVVAVGETVSINIDMAPPTGGWQLDGRLRIQSLADQTGQVWTAKINGVLLSSTADVSEPYPTELTHMTLTVDNYRAWIVPASLLIDGVNVVELTLQSGVGTDLWYLDLAMPTPRIAGDVNGDGFVGITDLNVILTNWNQSVVKGDWSQGDLAGTGDGFVGISDLNVVLSDWNEGTPPALQALLPVPEPAGLLGVAGFILLVLGRIH